MKSKEDVSEILLRLKKYEEEVKKSKIRLKEIVKKISDLLKIKKSLLEEIDGKIGETLEIREKLARKKSILKEKIHEMRRLREDREASKLELLETRRKLGDLRPPKGDVEKWRLEKESLESRYEVSDDDPRAEKHTVERIRDLARKISIHEECGRLQNRMKKLSDEIKRSDVRREEIKSGVEEARQFVEAMEGQIEIILKEATELQRKKDEIEGEINRLNKERENIRDKVEGLEARRRKALKRIGIEDTELAFTNVLRVIKDREGRARSAMKKLSEKKTLTLEEFAELVERGLIKE